jgi:hypothetical protein
VLGASAKPVDLTLSELLAPKRLRTSWAGTRAQAADCGFGLLGAADAVPAIKTEAARPIVTMVPMSVTGRRNCVKAIGQIYLAGLYLAGEAARQV